MLSVKTFIIVCPLVFLAGFIDAIAGGGGLISLPAYLLAGLPAHNAIATNKMSSTLGTTVTFCRYAKNGYVRWKLAALCAVLSIIGSAIGANLALSLSDHAFKIIMLCATPLCAFYILKSKSLDNSASTAEGDERRTYILSAIIALVMGTYDGFYGPGTGTFLLLFLTAVVKLKLTDANGIAKAVNLASNISAFTVYLTNGKIIIPLGLAAGVCSFTGNYLGSAMFTSKGVKIAKPVLVCVLVIFMVKLAAEIF